VHVLPAQVLQSEHLYLNELGKMLRPGSLMLLDIELEPLEFVPADEPWRSLDLVPWFRGSCRGLCIKLFTNKSFVATKLIGVLQQSNLSDDVLDKEQIAEEVVPELIEFVSRAFPWTLRSKQPNALSIGPLDTDDVAEHFDLVVGPEENGQVWIGGRIVEKRFKVNPKDSDEADAWKLLAEDQLKEHVGVSAKELFPTVVLEHRPQRVHRMRGKLKGDFGNADQGAIRTGDGAYRLDAQLRVGIVEPRGLRP
jgi:hypothetical protein